MKRLVAFAVALCAAGSLFADMATVNGIVWKYRVSDGKAEIYNTDSLAAIPTSTTGAITIPSMLGGYPVTRIGSSAFRECKNLTSVTIPNIVASIGSSAFEDCSGLTSVTIPNGVASIEVYVFQGCSGLKSVTIPNSVKSIGYAAFFSCSGLTSVTIPNSVTSIGDRAFGYCSGLKAFLVGSGNANYSSANGLLLSKDGKKLIFGVNGDVTIPNSVTSIGDNAFYNYSGLTRVTIPNSVTSIGEYAFSGCRGLTSVTIGNHVTSIGYRAFVACSGLTSVMIPKSVTSIDWEAFADCSGLARVWLPRYLKENLHWSVFEECPDDMVITYYDKAGYTIDFHRNDASNGKEAAYDFDYGVSTALPKLGALGWARRGFDFKGWATSQANAAAGKVWKTDGAVVSTATEPGMTLNVWAVWELRSDSYAIQFIRNDGAGTWRIVGFKHGTKTRIPSLAKGLGWARRGYQFNGWALSAANANNGKVWKGDWANIATPTAAGTMLTAYASWSLKPGFYQVRFNKNDGSGKWRTLGFECGASAKLNTIKGLGWEIPGSVFGGWASSKANADAKKLWKTDGAWVKDATAEGKTLSIYALWR